MKYKYLVLITLLFTQLSYAAKTSIVFSKQCSQGDRLEIAAVGDILLHAPLQIKASNDGFSNMWQVATPYVQKADIAYANLEGSIAAGIDKSGRVVDDPGHVFDDRVYTSFPLFNYHPSLADELKQSGFTIVSTANNHSLDRYAIGIEKTIDELNRVGLKHTGSKKRNSNYPWMTIIEKNGFKIGWLACTENTNGVEDKYNQVLHCFKSSHRKQIIDSILQNKDKLDAIIVSPHWGIQYNHEPTRAQRVFAKQVLDAGALAVIGSHPHVLQPMEKYISTDGRETFILYSLGNFISYQGTPKNRTTIVLLLDLVKSNNTTSIAKVSYVPMYMQNRQGLNQIELTKISKGSQALPSRILQSVLPWENSIYSIDALSNCNS